MYKEAIIYCRCSSAPQTRGHSLQRQYEGCVEWARKKDYKIVAVWSEVGSDFPNGCKKPSKLPIREEVIRMARERKCSIIIEDYDRWSRNPSSVFSMLNKDFPQILSLTEENRKSEI